MPRRETRSSWPSGWGWIDPAAIPPPGLYNSMRAGVPVTLHTSLQIDSVFTAMRVLSNAIVNMGVPRAFTWALDRTNVPYRKWLDEQPPILSDTWGGRMFQFDGTTRTVMSLGIMQEAFWFVLERDELGYPSALEVLNPAFMEVKPDKQNPGRVIYRYGAESDRVTLVNEDVVHIPFMAFPGALRALNGVEYGGVAFALALAAMEFGEKFFAQGASPSFVLSTDQKLGRDEIRRLAERFQIQHAGLDNAHTPLFLDSGLSVQKIQSTPDEAQFLQTLDYARSVIAAWFGLPPHLIGGSNDRGNVWGRTVAEQGQQMVNFTLSGYTTRLCEAFASLLPAPIHVAMDEEAIQRADPENMAKLIISKRQAGVETQNEIRVGMLRKPPIDGADDLNAPLTSNTSPPVGQVMADELAKAEGISAPAAPEQPQEEQ